MMELTQLDILKDFIDFARDPEHDLNAILKRFGGGSIYVPTYRTVKRDEDLIADFKEGKQTQDIIRELCQKYDLSKNRVWELTKEVRNPSLF